MTQTMTRPPARGPRPAPATGRPSRGPRGARPRASSTLFAAEVALMLVTMAAVVGMHRLFTDGSYRPALLGQALAAHATVALLRRARVPLPLAGVATAVAALLALTWGHYLDTTATFLPTGETLSSAGDDLSAAWALFQDVQAPAPVESGFLVAGGAAVWLMVFVADWAAFRASATFEALLPSATLFLFAAALGAPGGRVAGATLYASAAMLFVLLRRTLEQEATAAWASSHRARGRWSLLGSGAVLVGIAAATGAFAGPNLPGADDEPVIAWRDIGDGQDPRIVVSPMVDIQARMIEQPEVELFTVTSEQPDYWRLTSLDAFDGEIWKSTYGTKDATGRLPHDVDSDVPIRRVDQEIAVSSLAQVWLPAAYEPVAIDVEGGKVDWDERSGTLIVDREETDSDGLRYTVASDVPIWSEAQLRAAGDEVPEAIRRRYLGLPELNPAIQELAEQRTENATNPYDKALALQTYLRTFEYDLTVPPGHTEDALSTFLFETKRGFCEQFAGSMAAMARTIGLPSRVVVGFTQGIRDDEVPNLYHVRGEHAHAWVEIYLHELGWVLFDPTPTRGPPRAQDWLGIEPQQDQPGGNGQTAETVPVPTTAPPAAGDAGSGTETGRPGTDTRTGDPFDTGGDGGGRGVTDTLRSLATGLLGALAAYLALVPLALAAQVALRRRRAATPAARVRLAWRDAVERASASGTPLPPSLTVGEAASRMAHELPEAAPAADHLAALMERTVYAEVEPTDDDAVSAVEARGDVVAAADRRLSGVRRVLRHIDARELWRRHSPHHRRTAQLVPSAPGQG